MPWSYAQKNEYRSKNKDVIADQNRWYKYGITGEDYKRMLSAQNFSCAICGTKEPAGKGSTFHVDHCHVTKAVRGLLCHHCNTSLGGFKDSPVLLREAASYLESFNVNVLH
jgi:hypothetical protein